MERAAAAPATMEGGGSSRATNHGFQKMTILLVLVLLLMITAPRTAATAGKVVKAVAALEDGMNSSTTMRSLPLVLVAILLITARGRLLLLPPKRLMLPAGEWEEKWEWGLLHLQHQQVEAGEPEEDGGCRGVASTSRRRC
uniref:Uncharacterized protein n=1 Tax=Arundo donax TaxID=35708 RepID=A0A0A9ASR9_ARUDO